MEKDFINNKATSKHLLTAVIVLIMAISLAASVIFAWFLIPDNLNVSNINMVIKGNDYLLSYSSLKNGEEVELDKLFQNLIPQDKIKLILTIEKTATRPLFINIDFDNITGEEIRDKDNNPTGYNMKDMYTIQVISPVGSSYIDYNSYTFNQLNSSLINSYLLDTTYVTFEFEITFKNSYENYVETNLLQNKSFNIGTIIIKGV